MTTRQAVLIDRVTLVVSDLDRAEDDYVKTLGCSIEQRDDIEPSLTGVLCIRSARGRRSLLRLGRERVELLEFTDSAGRPYPPDSTTTDLWFQHMAIVVNDMTDAHQRVMANRRFRPISRNGPVRLPDNSGGVTAFKFRDHDGHPLELLAFPEGRVPRAWRNADGAGPFSVSITPLSRLATRPAARSSSGPYSGSAPAPAPRTAGPNKTLSTTSTTSTSASPGSRPICLRHGWNCCATTRAHACRSLPAQPAMTSWRHTLWCGSRRSTRPPRHSHAAARPWPVITS